MALLPCNVPVVFILVVFRRKVHVVQPAGRRSAAIGVLQLCATEDGWGVRHAAEERRNLAQETLGVLGAACGMVSCFSISDQGVLKSYSVSNSSLSISQMSICCEKVGGAAG